jgi:hypothetical protein
MTISRVWRHAATVAVAVALVGLAACSSSKKGAASSTSGGSTSAPAVMTTQPFTAQRIAQLYPSRSVYLQRYTADVDATIKAGFALPRDRAALMAFAEPSVVAG